MPDWRRTKAQCKQLEMQLKHFQATSRQQESLTHDEGSGMPRMADHKPLLICHRGALGDFVLTWPTLLCLRRLLPDTPFLGLGKPDHLRLAQSLRLVDLSFDAESKELMGFFEGSSLPAVFGDPDGAVLWLADGGGTAELLRPTATRPVVLIKPFPASPTTHIASYYLNTAASAYPVTPPADLATLFPWRPPGGKRNGVLIHPGSGSVKKNFSSTFYLSLAEVIEASFHVEVSFLLGPVEQERGESAAYQKTGKVIRPGSAVELAAALSQATLLIGNDTGPTHLAGALGVAVIALHKSTDPAIWGALGGGVTHIAASDMATARSEALQHARRVVLAAAIPA